MGNSFGTLFRISSWGESHGGGIGVVIDGCPPRMNYAKMISNHILTAEDPVKVNLPLQEMKLTKLKFSPELSRAKPLAPQSPCL